MDLLKSDIHSLSFLFLLAPSALPTGSVYSSILDKTINFILGFLIINNYSPKAKWILVNIPRDEVEGNIHQYSRAWGE